MDNIKKFNAFFEGVNKKIDISKNKTGLPNYEAYCLMAEHRNSGQYYREFSGINSLYKTDYGLLIKSNGGDEIKVTKDSFTFNGSNAFIYSYYTKQMSKFYRDAQIGQYFYKLIEENFPDNNIPFVTPEKLKEDGWRQSKILELKFIENNMVNPLYENNTVIFIKDDKYLLFDFNEYIGKIYDDMEVQQHPNQIFIPQVYPGKLLKEITVRSKKDYESLINF